MKKKKVIKSHIKKLIDSGLEDIKAGRVITYDKSAPSKVTVDFPICIDFFNDTGKTVHIRTTPFTHSKNPDMIPIKSSAKIYVQSGFLKLWDEGTSFRLLVE